MSNERILVVEDEPSFIEALKSGLQREGFVVDVATDGFSAVERFHEFGPDLILLDLMLPGQSGVEVCRRVRAESNVPIIMVTAKSSEVDTVVGLEVGADDYVAKPYRIRELTARIRAQLRRRVVDSAAATDPHGIGRSEVLSVGGVTLDPDRHEVVVAGEQVSLPLKEFQVLQLLMRNAGLVVRRETLIDEVWGYDYVGDTKTLDVHIKRLRARLQGDGDGLPLISTVRGVGYRLNRSD